MCVPRRRLCCRIGVFLTPIRVCVCGRWGPAHDEFIFATFSGSVSCFSTAPRTENDFSEAMGGSASLPPAKSSSAPATAAPSAPQPQPGVKLPGTAAPPTSASATDAADSAALSAKPLPKKELPPPPPQHPLLPLSFPPSERSWASVQAAAAATPPLRQPRRCACRRRSAHRASPTCMYVRTAEGSHTRASVPTVMHVCRPKWRGCRRLCRRRSRNWQRWFHASSRRRQLNV